MMDNSDFNYAGLLAKIPEIKHYIAPQVKMLDFDWWITRGTFDLLTTSQTMLPG